MDVIIGKQKFIQYDKSNNLLDEKGSQYNFLDTYIYIYIYIYTRSLVGYDGNAE